MGQLNQCCTHVAAAAPVQTKCNNNFCLHARELRNHRTHDVGSCLLTTMSVQVLRLPCRDNNMRCLPTQVGMPPEERWGARKAGGVGDEVGQQGGPECASASQNAPSVLRVAQWKKPKAKKPSIMSSKAYVSFFPKYHMRGTRRSHKKKETDHNVIEHCPIYLGHFSTSLFNALEM
jgi:hypothetical protein